MAAKRSAKTSARPPARIRHIALCVKDIKETADFYEKAFGLKRTPIREGATAWNCYM
ncbi:MAG: VOC family protein, partial [Xanthobacteraceae bacterium]|nr:VOC family protein [Xanthobacteraceae bacterium]